MDHCHLYLLKLALRLFKIIAKTVDIQVIAGTITSEFFGNFKHFKAK